MMQPSVISGAVEKPNSSAPSRAATAMSRPVRSWPSVCSRTRCRRSLARSTWCVSARPSSHVCAFQFVRAYIGIPVCRIRSAMARVPGISSPSISLHRSHHTLMRSACSGRSAASTATLSLSAATEAEGGSGGFGWEGADGGDGDQQPDPGQAEVDSDHRPGDADGVVDVGVFIGGQEAAVLQARQVEFSAQEGGHGARLKLVHRPGHDHGFAAVDGRAWLARLEVRHHQREGFGHRHDAEAHPQRVHEFSSGYFPLVHRLHPAQTSCMPGPRNRLPISVSARKAAISSVNSACTASFRLPPRGFLTQA